MPLLQEQVEQNNIPWSPFWDIVVAYDALANSVPGMWEKVKSGKKFILRTIQPKEPSLLGSLTMGY